MTNNQDRLEYPIIAYARDYGMPQQITVMASIHTSALDIILTYLLFYYKIHLKSYIIIYIVSIL